MVSMTSPTAQQFYDHRSITTERLGGQPRESEPQLPHERVGASVAAAHVRLVVGVGELPARARLTSQCGQALAVFRRAAARLGSPVERVVQIEPEGAVEREAVALANQSGEYIPNRIEL